MIAAFTVFASTMLGQSAEGGMAGAGRYQPESPTVHLEISPTLKEFQLRFVLHNSTAAQIDFKTLKVEATVRGNPVSIKIQPRSKWIKRQLWNGKDGFDLFVPFSVPPVKVGETLHLKVSVSSQAKLPPMNYKVLMVPPAGAPIIGVGTLVRITNAKSDVSLEPVKRDQVVDRPYTSIFEMLEEPYESETGYVCRVRDLDQGREWILRWSDPILMNWHLEVLSRDKESAEIASRLVGSSVRRGDRDYQVTQVYRSWQLMKMTGPEVFFPTDFALNHFIAVLTDKEANRQALAVGYDEADLKSRLAGP